MPQKGAASLTKLAAGPLGDRFARRPLIATGYGMAALGKVIVAAAGAWPGVLAGRVVDRLGKGIRGAPRDALLVENIDDAARGRVFGFHRAADTFGAVVGPLLGLVGYELLDHQIAPLLWVAVVPAVLSVALVFLVQETRRIAPAHRSAIFARVRDLPRRYWRVAGVLVAFGVVNFPDALLLLRLNEIGFSVVEVILAYVGYNLVYALSSYPAGLLADRMPRPAVFGFGLVFFADRLHRARPDHQHRRGVDPDRCLRTVHRMHRRRWQGVDFIARRIRPAGHCAGGVPGAQRVRGVGRRSVGGLAVGRRRARTTAGVGRRRCGVRGRAAERGPALRTRYDDLDVVEGIGRRADAGHRVPALRRAFGDPGLGGPVADSQRDRALVGSTSSGRASKTVPCQ